MKSAAAKIQIIVPLCYQNVISLLGLTTLSMGSRTDLNWEEFDAIDTFCSHWNYSPTLSNEIF